MSALFISDLHLQDALPGITDILLRFLKDKARRAQALYVLGDLFEYWIGDDASLPANPEIVAAFAALAETGVPLYFMHGNRDFLIGAAFAAATGAHILPDPTVVELFGKRTLLMHGDTLCTDDTAYQAFRSQVRDPENQRSFLSLPIEQRCQIARTLRQTSHTSQSGKNPEIMDVNPQAVEQAMRAHGVRRLIHGHTHRPAIHEWALDGTSVKRIVLSDWSNRKGSVLVCDQTGCCLQSLR